MRKAIIFSVIILLIISCGEKRIDSSTDERLQKSLDSIRESLSEDKKVEFEEAIKAITISAMDSVFESDASPEDMAREIKNTLDGKTADEVIAEGNQIIAERSEKKREQLLGKIDQLKNQISEVNGKIAEIEEKKAKADRDKENLKQFKVLDSQFYFHKDSFMDRPVIELTVKNNTEHSVSRAYFYGVLATPGRSVPWVKDPFNYKISGGLEPGEQVTWKLSPNIYSEWAKAPKDRNDMVLTVTMKRIDGPDEKAIFDSEFSKWDQNRLQELKGRLEQLSKNLEKLESELT
ncbi:MAG: hypothetical protein JSV38_15665 [Desulfobacterales bacterium]|nr:MAG: hypothetical protein JSV38_15665 [Desulfobacterales bacterium]